MILSCNSCGKRFVVPDQAITSEGRVVQCGSCGNKWKQYPINEDKVSLVQKTKSLKKKSQTTKLKPKKKIIKKKREIDLYSPEYLAKKHGITLNNEKEQISKNNKVSFGFYGSFLILMIFLIAFSRSLYFFQDFIIIKFPFTEYYLEYFFESIRNLFEIWKNLISNY